jgi:hypothetical protein
MEADSEWVVAAADTLRHAELFRPGRRGIVAASAEEGLKARVTNRPEVYVATHDGAAGVLEGLAHFGFVEPQEMRVQAGSPRDHAQGAQR